MAQWLERDSVIRELKTGDQGSEFIYCICALPNDYLRTLEELSTNPRALKVSKELTAIEKFKVYEEVRGWLEPTGGDRSRPAKSKRKTRKYKAWRAKPQDESEHRDFSGLNETETVRVAAARDESDCLERAAERLNVDGKDEQRDALQALSNKLEAMEV